MSANISIRVDDELLASIDALCDEETSRSQVARKLMRQALNGSHLTSWGGGIKIDPHTTVGTTSTENPTRAIPVNTLSDNVEKCKHPITRRIGNACGQCGKDLK